MEMTNCKKTAILLIAAMIFAGGMLAATVLAADDDANQETAGVTQWEYCLMTVNLDQPKQELGRQILKLGREGWELVCVENFSVSGSTTKTAHYFKRRL